MGTCLARGSGRVRVRVRVKTSFERRSRDRTRVDGVCDFEKVPPDQLCPSAKRDQLRVRVKGTLSHGDNVWLAAH